MNRHIPDHSFLDELPHALGGVLSGNLISRSSGYYFIKSDHWHGICMSARVARHVQENLVWMHIPANPVLMIEEQWVYRLRGKTLASIKMGHGTFHFSATVVGLSNEPKRLVSHTSDIYEMRKKVEKALVELGHDLPAGPQQEAK